MNTPARKLGFILAIAVVVAAFSWLVSGCIAPGGAQQAAVGLSAQPIAVGDVQDSIVSQAGAAVQSGGDVRIISNGAVTWILAIGVVVTLFGYAIGKTVNRALTWPLKRGTKRQGVPSMPDIPPPPPRK